MIKSTFTTVPQGWIVQTVQTVQDPDDFIKPGDIIEFSLIIAEVVVALDIDTEQRGPSETMVVCQLGYFTKAFWNKGISIIFAQGNSPKGIVPSENFSISEYFYSSFRLTVVTLIWVASHIIPIY